MDIEMLEFGQIEGNSEYNKDTSFLFSCGLDGYFYGVCHSSDIVHVGVFEDKNLVSCIVYGIANDNNICTFSLRGKHEYHIPHLYIEYLATEKNHRNKNYGKQLIHTALRDASIRGGIKEAVADCVLDSEEYYRKIGLNVVEIPPRESHIPKAGLPLYGGGPLWTEKEIDIIRKQLTTHILLHPVPKESDYFIVPGDCEKREEFWKAK